MNEKLIMNETCSQKYIADETCSAKGYAFGERLEALPSLSNMTWRTHFRRFTEDLEKELLEADSYETFLRENRQELAYWTLPRVLMNVSSEPPLMDSCCDGPGLSAPEEGQKKPEGEKAPSVGTLARSAKLNRSFFYDILNGVKNPSRDVLICLALALRCGLDAANELLRYGMYPGLYVRDRRDAVLISCIVHGRTVDDANKTLSGIRQSPLRESRAGRRPAVFPDPEFRYETGEFTKKLYEAEKVNDFIETNSTEFLKGSFSDNLNRILELKRRTGPNPDLKPADVIGRSFFLPRETGYQYFSGRRNPSRNAVILLGFGLDCTPDELQQLLRSSGNAALYVRYERDCVLLKCRAQGLDVMRTQEELEKYFMNKYLSAGINPDDARIRVQEQLLNNCR